MTQFLNTYFWYHCHSPSPNCHSWSLTIIVSHNHHHHHCYITINTQCMSLMLPTSYFQLLHVKGQKNASKVCFFLFIPFFTQFFFWLKFLFLLDPSCCPHCPHSTFNLLISRAETTHQNTLFWPQVCAILFFLLFFTKFFFWLKFFFFFTRSLTSPMSPTYYLQLPYFKGRNNASKHVILALEYV